MSSLIKAFAYTGITLNEDQKIARDLSLWDPDDVVRGTITNAQYESISWCQSVFFIHNRGLTGASEKCNVDKPILNALFEARLIATRKSRL